MSDIVKRVKEVRRNHSPQSKQCSQKQQEYYRRLKSTGLTKPQPYNLAPVASI